MIGRSFICLFLLVFYSCSDSSPDIEEERVCIKAHSSDQKIAQDINEYSVDSAIDYQIEISQPEWIVHPDYKILPEQIQIMPSNNNVEIIYHENRLFMAWRSSKTHFASDKAKLFLMSSTDMGKTWDFEKEYAIGADLREPRFLSIKGKLYLYVVELGTNMTKFEPKKSWVSERLKFSQWTKLKTFIEEPEVIWDMKIRNGKAYMSSYIGAHYDFKNDVQIKVILRESEDGINWKKVNERDSVYTGGVSETAFEFDLEGNLWIVTRNEDGDETGFGSHLCFAPKEDISNWQCPEKSNPLRYDSPEMFRHGKDIYLLARRNPSGPYDLGEEIDDIGKKRTKYLIKYSSTSKRSALYKIDQKEKKIIHLQDIPGVGDTAFPSLQRLGNHEYLIANYSSPLDDPEINWINAQSSERGTQIYILRLMFKDSCSLSGSRIIK